MSPLIPLFAAAKMLMNLCPLATMSREESDGRSKTTSAARNDLRRLVRRGGPSSSGSFAGPNGARSSWWTSVSALRPGSPLSLWVVKWIRAVRMPEAMMAARA